MKKMFLILLSILLLSAAACEASWLIFHKPEFRGKIVDIETNDPIEGAIVVVIYRKEEIGIGDTVDIDIGAREALTDRNGEFAIPSYTTVISPLSWSIPAQFIIFKSGYYCTGPIGLEKEFSSTKEHRIEIEANSNQGLKFRVLKTGVLMLAKVAGKERIDSYDNAVKIWSLHKEFMQIPRSKEIINKENNIIIDIERKRRNK